MKYFKLIALIPLVLVACVGSKSSSGLILFPNNPPTAVDDSASTVENVAVAIDVMANDSDIDNDGISILSVSTPANGIAVITGGLIDYTPNTGFSGLDSFTYLLQDTFGDQETATVTVGVSANFAPFALDDTAIVNENDVVLIDMLLNDSDLDGDEISLVSVTAPTNGTNLIVNNKVEYTPSADYIGADLFTYVIEDVFGVQATATVFIDVILVQGSLVSWGEDDYAQITNTPLGDDFIQVSAGHQHSVALRADGSLESWGWSDWQDTDAPVGNDFAQVSAGNWHSVALRVDGSLVSWGWDIRDEIINTPSDPVLDIDFTQVSAGHEHSVALRADGSLESWGDDYASQVTDTPLETGFTQIASGGYHTVALRADGSLVSWGDDSYSQITDNPLDDGFTQIAAGGFHSVALHADGSLVSWGEDIFSQVADTPTGNDFIQVSAGFNHSVALRADGSLVAWGYDTDSLIPDTPTGTDFTQVSAGGDHSVAITF